ncbi:hypothetical protein M422DRAFT_23441, partial [Sphaerobolus stellatus SS14]
MAHVKTCINPAITEDVRDTVKAVVQRPSWSWFQSGGGEGGGWSGMFHQEL